MIRKNNARKKFPLLSTFSLFLLLFSTCSFALEGDLVWEKPVNLSTGHERAFGVAVDSTGLYAVGFQNDLMLWRVEKRQLNDGSLIWERAENLTGGVKIPAEVAVDSTGVYIVGYQNRADVWRVEKRNPDTGALIWQRQENLTARQDVAEAVAIDGSGLYVGGSQDGEALWRVEKRNPNDGSLIWQQVANLTAGEDVADGITVDGTGVYAVGHINTGRIWRVEKRNLDTGALIWQATADFAGVTEGAIEAAVDATGVYAAGGRGSNWWIEKRSPVDGSLIWEKQGSSGMARGIGLSTTGVYISGGISNFFRTDWRVEKRNLSNGELLWEVQENFSGNSDWSHQTDYYTDGLYVVGGQDDSGVWRVERREKVVEGIANCTSLVANPDSGTSPFASTISSTFENAEGMPIDFDCDGDRVVEGTATVSGGSASYACNYGPVASQTIYTASAAEPVNGSFCTTNVTVNEPIFCDGTCDGTCSNSICPPAQDPDCSSQGCCGDGVVQVPNGQGLNEECDGGGLPGCTVGTCQANCTCGTPGNIPPLAESNGPYSGDSGTAIDLTGSCSDFDGTVSNCNWSAPVGCSLGVQSKVGLGTANATSAVAATCVGSVGQAFTLSLTATDDVGATDVDSMLIIIVAAPTEFFLQITAFSAQKLSFVLGQDELGFGDVSVKVKNFGDAAVTPKVELGVLEALTDQPLSPSISSGQIVCPVGSGSVDPDSDCTWGLSDFPGFTVSSLGPGTYKLVARAFQSGMATPDDTEALYFTIIRPIPTPELSEFLLPLIACVVLAIVLFERKRH